MGAGGSSSASAASIADPCGGSLETDSLLSHCAGNRTSSKKEEPAPTPAEQASEAESLAVTNPSFNNQCSTPGLVPTKAPTALGYEPVKVGTPGKKVSHVEKNTVLKDLEGMEHAKGELNDGGNGLFSTNLDEGLSQPEAEKRLALFGHNELPEKKKNIWLALAMEFLKPMAIIVWLAVILELVAGCIEYSQGNEEAGHGDIIDVFALLMLQFLNVFVGFFEELEADKAIDALKKGLLPKVDVFRGGVKKNIDGRDVAIGDIVYIASGNTVPADGYILPSRPGTQTHGSKCEVDESAINGESLPRKAVPWEKEVSGKEAIAQLVAEHEAMKTAFYEEYPVDHNGKFVHELEDDSDRKKKQRDLELKGDKCEGAASKVLMGTVVQSGSESIMLATATGARTTMGMTAQLMTDDQGEGHFEELLNDLLWVLVVMGVVVNIIIVAYLLTLATPPPVLNVLSFAVVLLIASIPIALRVVCVTTLALGTRELSHEGAIVSKMNAVEEIASMTLLCSDKTGTLTQNRMEMVPLEEQVTPDLPEPKTKEEKERQAKLIKVWRAPGVTFDNIMQHAVLAMKWWHTPGDAIDKLLVNYACKFAPVQSALRKYYDFDEEEFKPFHTATKRTESTIHCVPTKVSGLSEEDMKVLRIRLPMATYVEVAGVQANPEKGIEGVEEKVSQTAEQLLNPVDNKDHVDIVNYHEDGQSFSVTKGAPHTILDLIEPEERNRIKEEFLASVTDLGRRGIRSLAVAMCRHGTPKRDAKGSFIRPEGSQWTMLGILAFKDPLRADSEATAKMCEHLGVNIKMITGDNHLIALETCRGMDLEKRVHKDGPDKGKKYDLTVVKIDRDANGQTSPLPSIEVETLKELAEDKKKISPLLHYVENIDTWDEEYANGVKSQYEWYVENEIHEVSGCHDDGKHDPKNHHIIKCGDISDNASAFAGVFPEHKYLIVAALQQKFREPIGMTGDGVNDAPALHRANIGIAVQGCTDAARSAADIVLTKPGLSAIVDAIVISRKIFTRMKNFVVYRIACTLQLLFFFLVACLAYNPTDYCATEEFFFVPVIALVTIVILNDGTIISVAFDNVKASKNPEEWNMTVISIVSSVVGLIALISSIILLHVGLECSGNYEARLVASGQASLSGAAQCHNNDENFLTTSGTDSLFGLDQLHYNGVKTMIYLKIALSDYLSLFNSRTHSWFFLSAPSYHVVIAAVFSTVVSSLLARWWPLGAGMEGVSWSVIAFVWLWTIVWGLIQDACKVFTYWILKKAGFAEEMEVLDENHAKTLMAEPKAAAESEAKIKESNEKVIKAYYATVDDFEKKKEIHYDLDDVIAETKS
jgi:magnesium-transporting ATPase (P-type)